MQVNNSANQQGVWNQRDAQAESPPQPNLSPQQRGQLVDAYAKQLETQIANIESGTEAERNVKFLIARPFTTPSGYFGGGLRAAGYDPDQPIHVTFNRYTGLGRPESNSGSDERTYSAWEVASGVLEHDRPEEGGTVNFESMRVDPAQADTVRNLESLGARLEDHWTHEVAEPMEDAQGTLAARSGKADAYSVQVTLQSLQSDNAAFERLSPEGQQAVKRTLGEGGQAIIPNLYGYPLAGHAFIPYQPYDGNFEHRPNQGLMIDLNHGAVCEIHGDEDFADWAARNRDDMLHSFNASDLQGGRDAHWPKAGDVLDNVIAKNNVTYPGYRSPVSDQPIPASELFNFTRSRGDDYQLKYGNLKAGAGNGIASQYQAVNVKNAVWADQTEVFGATEKNWKTAKGMWGRTVGEVPIVGNIGNIAFGVHDSLYGMTPQDRVGGNVAAAMGALELMHEGAAGAAGATAGEAAGAAAGEAPVVANPVALSDHPWQYSPKTHELRFTPPQRVNGQIGYPMSPMGPPRLDPQGERPGLPAPGGDAASAHEPAGEDTDASSTASAQSSVHELPGHAVADQADPADQVDQSDQADQADQAAGHRSDSLVASPDSPPSSRAPSTRSSLVPEPPAGSSHGESQMTSRRSSAQSTATSGIQNTNPLSADEDAGFRRQFPGGLDAAESYLKSKGLNMIRSPAWLASDQYPAPRSWAGLVPAERNRLMERYLSVWDPAPRRADYATEAEFMSNQNAYNDRIGQYKVGGNFDIEKYWNDLVSTQNNGFRTFVDNQSKRLASAAKAYDDFTANPTRYRAKPDDPNLLRQQMRGQQDLRRDAIFLQREALDFGENRFYKLDDRSMSELRSHFLGLFGRQNAQIEAAFIEKKNSFEDELYRYGNTNVSRELVEAKKRALQARFNSDVDIAAKNMDLMYKRIALYGTVGTLSLSALSAILWKTIDEIRHKS